MAVVVAVGLEVVDEVLAVAATAAAAAVAAVAAVVVVSAMFSAAVVVVAEEVFEEQHCLSKGELVVRVARLKEPVLSAEVDKASPI